MKNPFRKKNIVVRNADTIILVAACLTIVNEALPLIAGTVGFVANLAGKAVDGVRNRGDAGYQRREAA